MKRVGISLILLTLIVPLGLVSTAWAGDKEEVAAAAAKWADAFSAETPRMASGVSRRVGDSVPQSTAS